ncbi:MAG: glycoside hydrolase family 43 protein [Bacteroidales bacterium]|nr:glycoside hydrolase family 43 protein [Candidatus Liminaster caballi]
MKIRNIAFCLLAMLSAHASADTITLTDADLTSAYVAKNPSRTSVHDPSVFMDTVSSPGKCKYYVIGSHLGFTSSMNLTSWAGYLGGGESAGCTLFADTLGNRIGFENAYSVQKVRRVRNYQGTMVDFPNFDAHAWQSSGFSVRGNQWAPDVVWNPTMQKWLLYMSVNGDAWCSSIVCLAADKPTGPFVYQGPVVVSGFSGHFDHNSVSKTNDWQYTDLAIATGCTSLPSRYNKDAAAWGEKWGDYWPNCIDPCAFYDEDGKLWLSYGSWSGGIWLLELDETNGLRDYTVEYPLIYNKANDAKELISDPYFGKKIAGGYYVSGEGSYIEHIGDYYHLFISYGGFAPDGGYQMRVYRSEQPDGPYYDCNGFSAIQGDRYEMNYGPNATSLRGSLLMGAYQWELMPTAEIAQGHNSAFTDREGRSFVVYHTKFNDGTFGHTVRVHQLFQNEEGWLVTSPYEYGGETQTQDSIATTESIGNDEIPGTYDLIIHNYKQSYENMSYVKPVTVELKASATDPSSGTSTGYGNGTWRRIPGTDFIEITLYNVTYKGVLTRQTIDYSNISAVCFTAVSSSSGTVGTSRQRHIWGSKADARGAFKYTLNGLNISLRDGQTVKNNLTLPTDGKMHTTVTWRSSDTSVLTNSGVVKGDGYVTLTLTLTRDNYKYEKVYNLTVGNAQGITSLSADEDADSASFYDLCGRKVTTPENGHLYIQNGKRVMYQR